MVQREIQAQVVKNLANVMSRIQDAAAAADNRDVTLVCVTKYAEDDWARALVEAGATDLAENYLPRAAERFEMLFAEGLRFKRHMIGSPQSRKVKFLPGCFDMVQALDRQKTTRLLNDLLVERDERMDVLLQVNIAGEEQKHGVNVEDTESSIAWIIENCAMLNLRGLMAVPPWPDAYADDAEYERETRSCFQRMKQLFDRMCRLYPAAKLDTLSMGMSQDFTWAIAEGATMVRVGSALYAGLN